MSAPPSISALDERRRAVLMGQMVEYRLARTRRRSIGIEVGLAGLTVRAPLRLPLREVDAALVARGEWILRALERWRGRRRDVLPRAWVPGATILYLGAALALDLRRARERAIATDLFHFCVRHPAPDDDGAIACFVGDWLRGETLRAFGPEARAMATRLGVGAPTVRVSNARNLWGSCTRAGVVRLNRRLVHLPPSLARYVVAHEVAHLAEMNHSPQFWACVEALYPGHREARRALGEWSGVLEAEYVDRARAARGT